MSQTEGGVNLPGPGSQELHGNRRMKLLTRLAQIGAVLVLLLTTVNPVAACLQDTASLSAAERACCKRMGPMCASGTGAHQLPCCRVDVNTPGDALALAAPVIVVSPDFTMFHGARQPEPPQWTPWARRVSFLSPSPPQSRLSSLQVFRI